MKILLAKRKSVSYLFFAAAAAAGLIFAVTCAEPAKVEKPAAEQKAPVANIDRKPDSKTGENAAEQDAGASRRADSKTDAQAALDTGFEPGEYNIILVTVDTERADATEPYGSSVETTPFLAELAKRGITFENAFSPAPWTAPAMYSIITGIYPSEHGIKSGVTVVSGRKMEISGQEVLPDAAHTLTEALKENGWATFGVSTNLYLNSRFGFDQGFDRFAGGDFSSVPFPNMAVKSLYEHVSASGKWFFWLHYFDPHFPYLPHTPWFTRWNKSKFNSYIDVSEDYVLSGYRKNQKKQPGEPVEERHLNLVYKTITRFISNPDILLSSLPGRADIGVGNSLDFLKAAYWSEIRRTDEAMREALSLIERGGKTIIVATADHGEEFLDHGGVGHRQHESVYQELIHVPLVICLPGGEGAGKRIDTPVSTIDLFPTLLELIGKRAPAGLSGESLVPLLMGRAIAERPIYSETKENRHEIVALIEYPWKLIYNYRKRAAELYNLQTDPKEEHNLADKKHERAEEMQNRLFDWKKSATQRWKLEVPAPLTNTEIERLRAMGYLR